MKLNLPFQYVCRTKTRGKAEEILIFLCQGENECLPLWSILRLELEELPLCLVQFKLVTVSGFLPIRSQSPSLLPLQPRATSAPVLFSFLRDPHTILLTLEFFSTALNYTTNISQAWFGSSVNTRRWESEIEDHSLSHRENVVT